MFDNAKLSVLIMIFVPFFLYISIMDKELKYIKLKVSGQKIFKPMEYIFLLLAISNLLRIYYSYSDIWYKYIFINVSNFILIFFSSIMIYILIVLGLLEKDKNISSTNLLSFFSLSLGQVIVQYSIVKDIYTYGNFDVFLENCIVGLFNFSETFWLLSFFVNSLLSIVLLIYLIIKYKIDIKYKNFLFTLKIVFISILLAIIIDNIKYEKNKSDEYYKKSVNKEIKQFNYK